MKKYLLTAILGLSAMHVNASGQQIPDDEYSARRPAFLGVPRNMGPIPDLSIRDLPEGNEDCNAVPFFGQIGRGFSSFFDSIAESMGEISFVGWPVITNDDEVPHRVYMEGLTDGDNSSSTEDDSDDEKATPLTKKTSTDLGNAPHSILDEEAIVEKPKAFLENLISTPDLNPIDIFKMIKSEEECTIAMEFMSIHKDPKFLNFSNCNPLILRGFISYMNRENNCFKNLSVLICDGHNLTPPEISDLLKNMAASNRPDAKLILTPGEECNSVILVSLAARYTRKNPQLTIFMAGVDLPYGYETLSLPQNLKLANCRSIKTENTAQVLKIMKDIMKEKKVQIFYGNDKILKLEN